MLELLKQQYNNGYVFLDIPYNDKEYYKRAYKGSSFTFDPLTRHWVCDITDLENNRINQLFAIIFIDVEGSAVYVAKNHGAKYDRVQQLYYTTYEHYDKFENVAITNMVVDGQVLRDRVKLEQKQYFENNS